MLISVIVPIYNVEEYLSRCIDSILAQTYKELEILLVDDGSTDASGSICDDYAAQDPRVRVIHCINSGPGAARNTGIKHAKGEYIAFVDGDDWLELTMYQSLIEAALTYDVQLVACRYRQIYPDHIKDKSTGKVTIYNKSCEMLLQQLKQDEAYLIQNAPWNKLYHRSLLADIRFPEGIFYEDAVFSVKVLGSVSRGVYLDTAGYNYVCVRQGSTMNAGLTERQFSDWIPVFLEIESYLKTLDAPELVATHQYYCYKRLLDIYREVYKKEYRNLRYHAKEIVYLLRQRKDTLYAVDALEISKKTDMWKIRLFLWSPTLFRWIMTVNDTLILPIRLKGLKRKNVNA